MHTIQIFGVDRADADLESLLRDALPDGARLSPQHEPHGLNIDPDTLRLIIDVSKDVLIPAITAISTVWAARIAAGAGNRDNQPPAPEVPKKVPVVVIDTLTDSSIV